MECGRARDSPGNISTARRGVKSILFFIYEIQGNLDWPCDLVNATVFGFHRNHFRARLVPINVLFTQFWDTAPSFEGRKEIWDALRAACESADFEFAQAVIESARIKLPTGILHRKLCLMGGSELNFLHTWHIYILFFNSVLVATHFTWLRFISQERSRTRMMSWAASTLCPYTA